jgi:hypothetical protein
MLHELMSYREPRSRLFSHELGAFLIIFVARQIQAFPFVENFLLSAVQFVP